MKTLEKKDLDDLDSRYRAKLVNSLSGFKPLNLIGSINLKGEENLAIFSSVFHLGSNPPLLGMIVRPNSSPRHTLENILETGVFSINHVSIDFYRKAHQTSARYERDQSEFDLCGLEKDYLNDWKAPFVKESPLRMGMKLVNKVEITENDTVMLMGEIQFIDFAKDVISLDGFVDLEALGIICGSSLDAYHKTEKLERLSYAKSDRAVQRIDKI